MIPGTFAIIGGGSGKTAELVASRSSTSILSSYTFTDVPLGYYDPTRIIVLSVHWFRFDTSSPLNSASVGGASTTSRVSTFRIVTGGSGSLVYSDLRTAAPTGTTGTISLSFTRSLNYGCAVGVWALYNVGSETPVATNVADTNGLFTLSAQPNDLVIAAATGVYDGTATTWVNATENFDIVTSRMLSSGAQRDVFSAGDPGVDFGMNVVSATPVGVAGIWR
jgi:hypothetical protein